MIEIYIYEDTILWANHTISYMLIYIKIAHRKGVNLQVFSMVEIFIWETRGKQQ